MKLLIVRHAPAGDRAAFARTGRPDAARPLTGKGRGKMRKAAAGLRRVLPSISIVATSALERAVQTGKILSRAYDGARAVKLKALAPGGKPQDLLRRLEAFPEAETLALVGHEPGLSALIAYLLAGRGRFKIELKKGAACLLDFEAQPRAGAGTLLWALTPSQLRRMAG